MRNFCFATALFLLLASVGLADIVPISLLQDVRGGPDVSVCDLSYPIPPSTWPFTCQEVGMDLNASNSQAGSYSVNKKGEAKATGPLSGSTLTETVQVQQSSDETSDSISVSMSTVDDFVGGGLPFAGVASELDNDYSFKFNLTTASIVHLAGSISHSSSDFSGDGSGSFGNTGFLLTGPGFQLGSPCPACDEYFPTGFDYTLVLIPGVYTLTAFADERDQTNAYYFMGSADGEFSFDAEFTPAVPEPRWVVLPALLLVIGIGGAAFRRRKPDREGRLRCSN